MLVFGLHFTYLPVHNVTSVVLLNLAWLAWMHVSHISGLVLTTCELAKIQKSSHLLIQFADMAV